MDNPIDKHKDSRRVDGTWKPGHTPPGAKPWKPGQSGNVKGRSKGPTILEAARKILDEKDPDRKALAQVIIRAALEGKWPFFKELIDRHDGPIGDGDTTPTNEQQQARLDAVVSSTFPSGPTDSDTVPEEIRSDTGGQAERQDGTGEEEAGPGPDGQEAVE